MNRHILFTRAIFPSISSSGRRPAGARGRRPWAFVALVALVVAAVAVSRPATAGPPLYDDEPMFAPDIELREIATEALVDAPSGSPLWVSLTGGAAFLPEGRSFSAMMVLGVPLDRVARRRGGDSRVIAGGPAASGAAGSAAGGAAGSTGGGAAGGGSAGGGAAGGGASASGAEEEASALKPAPSSKKARNEGGGPAPAPPPEGKSAVPGPAPKKDEAERPLEPPMLVTPDLARAAVRAALKRAKLEDPSSRIDGLASRARAASLLPELRFRVSRLVDEDQQLSPTEYDPGRVTASGGTSLWLEARATWRLDRIVFGDDEVALERMRNDRNEAQAKLIEKVLDLLFAWQRAEAAAACLAKSPEERLLARLKAIEAKASLDTLTGGAALGEAGPRPAAPSR